MLRGFLIWTGVFSLLWATACHSTRSNRDTGSGDSTTAMRLRLADSVKQEFSYAWSNYLRYGRGHDMLRPLTRSYKDWYSHTLYMTPLDGFDTMLIMGLKEEADTAKKILLDSLSFDYDMEVSQFEVTIRVMGGLLSAYEMDGEKKFLALATDLANRLIKAYHSPTGMPYRFVNLKTGETSGAVSNPAEIGTSLLEFGTLTRLTGDSLYYKTAKKAVLALFDRRSPKTGLVGSELNVETGQWLGKQSSIGGGTDSYYEYLLKSWKLFSDKDCKRMWDSSLVALNHYLADTAGGLLWYGHCQMDSGGVITPRYGALDAFFASCLAMAGDTVRAASLQQANYSMWELAGLEPEVLNYRKMEIINGYYALRPENMESCYYLYHYTHDPKYMEMGRNMFQQIVRYCRTSGGYAAIKDVRNMLPDDFMESYFLAETLKYAYLLFTDTHSGDVQFDQVVFNTEAHPLQRR